MKIEKRIEKIPLLINEKIIITACIMLLIIGVCVSTAMMLRALLFAENVAVELLLREYKLTAIIELIVSCPAVSVIALVMRNARRRMLNRGKVNQ